MMPVNIFLPIIKAFSSGKKDNIKLTFGMTSSFVLQMLKLTNVHCAVPLLFITHALERFFGKNLFIPSRLPYMHSNDKLYPSVRFGNL